VKTFSYFAFFLDWAICSFLIGLLIAFAVVPDRSLFLEVSNAHAIVSAALVWRLALFALAIHQLHRPGVLNIGASLHNVAGRSIISHWLWTPALPYMITIFAFGVSLNDWWIMLSAGPASNAITILNAYTHYYYLRIWDALDEQE